jgi:hypothetical protein
LSGTAFGRPDAMALVKGVPQTSVQFGAKLLF